MAKSIGYVFAVSLLTAFLLAGSIALPFYIVDIINSKLGIVGNPHFNGFVLLIAGLSIIVTSILIGGKVWGWSISMLTKIKTDNLAKSAAIIWTESVFAAGFVLYFSQLLGPPLMRITHFRIHTIFTIFFTLAIGLTVASVTYRITGKLGFKNIRKKSAIKAGLAAMIGFLIMSMNLLYVFKWEVGGPFAGQTYSMIVIMDACNTVAALLAGAVMGSTW